VFFILKNCCTASPFVVLKIGSATMPGAYPPSYTTDCTVNILKRHYRKCNRPFKDTHYCHVKWRQCSFASVLYGTVSGIAEIFCQHSFKCCRRQNILIQTKTSTHPKFVLPTQWDWSGHNWPRAYL